jgi:hypothetical protein
VGIEARLERVGLALAFEQVDVHAFQFDAHDLRGRVDTAKASRARITIDLHCHCACPRPGAHAQSAEPDVVHSEQELNSTVGMPSIPLQNSPAASMLARAVAVGGRPDRHSLQGNGQDG